MIIDATKYAGGEFRKGTVTGAVYDAFSAIPAGGRAEFTGLIDGFGEERDVREARQALGLIIRKGALSKDYVTRFREGKLVVLNMTDAG